MAEYEPNEIDDLLRKAEKQRDLFASAFLDERDLVYQLMLIVQHQEVRIQVLERRLDAQEGGK